MTTAVYATSYQTENYCAAYRLGVLTIVRLKDGYSLTLDLADTNKFKRLEMQFELENDDRDPVDRVCKLLHNRFRKRKWIVASFGGSVIEFHNAPVTGENV